MERADPLFLLIGLPTIPVMLILGKMIRWEDYVLRLWRKYSNKLQILNSIFPGEGETAYFFLLLSITIYFCSAGWAFLLHASPVLAL